MLRNNIVSLVQLSDWNLGFAVRDRTHPGRKGDRFDLQGKPTRLAPIRIMDAAASKTLSCGNRRK